MFTEGIRRCFQSCSNCLQDRSCMERILEGRRLGSDTEGSPNSTDFLFSDHGLRTQGPDTSDGVIILILVAVSFPISMLENVHVQPD